MKSVKARNLLCVLLLCSISRRTGSGTSTKTRFVLLTNQMTWNQANQACEDQGMSIVKVDTSLKQQCIVEYKNGDWSSLILDDVWIGLHEVDLTTPGHTQWADCTDVVYTDFQAGESKTTYDDDVFCYAINGQWGELPTWLSRSCDSELQAICEQSTGPCTFDEYPGNGCGHSLKNSGEYGWQTCIDTCLTASLPGGEECWGVGHYNGYSGNDCWMFYSIDDPDICIDTMYPSNQIVVGVKICFESFANGMTVPALAVSIYPNTGCFVTTTGTTATTTSQLTTDITTTQPTADTTTTRLTTDTTTTQPTTDTTTTRLATDIATTPQPTTTSITTPQPTTTSIATPQPTTASKTTPPPTTTSRTTPTTHTTTTQPTTDTTTPQPTTDTTTTQLTTDIATTPQSTTRSATQISTTGLPVTTTVTSIATCQTTGKGTTDPATSSNNNLCQCCIKNVTNVNLEIKIKKLKILLTVNKTETSLYKRRFISVADTRSSAVGIGCIGATVLILVVGTIIALDCSTFVAHVKDMWMCRSRRSTTEPDESIV